MFRYRVEVPRGCTQEVGLNPLGAGPLTQPLPQYQRLKYRSYILTQLLRHVRSSEIILINGTFLVCLNVIFLFLFLSFSSVLCGLWNPGVSQSGQV